MKNKMVNFRSLYSLTAKEDNLIFSDPIPMKSKILTVDKIDCFL